MPAPFDSPDPPESPSSLAVSLSATVTDARTAPAVEFALTVRNDGDEPITLRFRTGQRADFAATPIGTGTEPVEGTDPEPVWRHGDGRLFTQATGTETLSPGDAETYEGTWADPPPGTYAVDGWLTVSGYGVRDYETDGDKTDGDETDEWRPAATTTIEVE
ncbi:BsuPI-related putative proteinase inhibitor [Halorubrum pallidum]